MWTKLFPLALVCFIAGSCAWSPNDRVWVKEPYSAEYVGRTAERIGQQTFMVSAKSSDQVWDICERTLIRLGYPFYKADKTVGEIVVGSERTADPTPAAQETTALDKETSDPSWPEKIFVLLSRSDREVAVQVGVMYQRLDLKNPPPKSDSEWDRNSLYMKRVNREVDRVVGHLKKALGL